jgi:hypothetical protein
LLINLQHHGSLRIKSYPRSRRSIAPIPERTQRSPSTHINNAIEPSGPDKSHNKRRTSASTSAQPLRRPNSKTSTKSSSHPLRSHQPRRLRPGFRPLITLAGTRTAKPNSLAILSFRPAVEHHRRSSTRPEKEPRHSGAARARETAGEGGGGGAVGQRL